MEDLAWNSEFDPNLLAVWNDGADQEVQQDEQEEDDNDDDDNDTERISIGNPKEEDNDNDVDVKQDDTKSPLPSSVKGDGSWDGNANQWSHLGVVGAFSVDCDDDDDGPALSERSNQSSQLNDIPEKNQQGQSHSSSNSCSSTTNTGKRRNARTSTNAAAISETASLTSARDEERSATTGSSGSSSSPSQKTNGRQQQTTSLLHPLAIQSSASCPPRRHTTAASGKVPTSTQNNAPGPSIHGTIGGLFHIPQSPHAGDLYSVDLSQALERANVGFYASSQQQQQQLQQQQQHQGTGQPHNMFHANEHLNSLATNFLMASVQQPQISQTAAAINDSSGHHHHHHYQQQQQVLGTTQNTSTQSNTFSTGAAVQQGTSGRTSARSSKRSSSGKTTTSSSSIPPFYLFDAPIELRANFMANQRKLGLPIEHDPNSYHYGEIVNGFHPHQFVNNGGGTDGQPPLMPAGLDLAQIAAAAGAAAPNWKPPQLIDARHGTSRRSRGGQMKNEREQKRAQKITDLIEQLRNQMEEGGWQVEGRSKFNTLAT
jgi:hypothetical protein